MACCPQLDRMLDRDLVKNAQPYQLSNGTIITDIDTEFFLVFGEERRVLSRELWNLEKKK